jgi:hypothetical protein
MGENVGCLVLAVVLAERERQCQHVPLRHGTVGRRRGLATTVQSELEMRLGLAQLVREKERKKKTLKQCYIRFRFRATFMTNQEILLS